MRHTIHDLDRISANTSHHRLYSLLNITFEGDGGALVFGIFGPPELGDLFARYADAIERVNETAKMREEEK